MSEPGTPPATASLWRGGALVPREDCDVEPATVLVADSWLVEDGAVRGLELHRERFLGALPPARTGEASVFWEAAIAALPRAGAWFPRVELREQRGDAQLLLRVRPAPERRDALVLASHPGRDPRTTPQVKGPDLAAMLRLRTEAQAHGADDAVLLDRDGRLVEGSTTSIVWWAGEVLCVVDSAVPRIPSITERTLVTLATALGVTVAEHRLRPEELDGCEVWALNALHGARIVTAWHGERMRPAEQPGRLARWRMRLDALRRPLPAPREGGGA